MILLETLAVAFSAFSVIPMPARPWTDRNLRYALLAFPLVGLTIGLLSWALAALCSRLGIPPLLEGALLFLLPILITGGIHLDGFSDTCDALASHRSPDRMQEILKDPHVGSFAVIRVCCVLILSFSLWSVLPDYRPVPVMLCFCLSRSLSGLSLLRFPPAREEGMAWTFRQAAAGSRCSVLLTVLSVVLTVLLPLLCGLCGLLMAAAALGVFLAYARLCRKRLGGVSGDPAGWFLTLCELWMLLALVLGELLEGMV